MKLRPRNILESAIYGPDLAGLREFYLRVLGLHEIGPAGAQGYALRAGPSVLLLFDPEGTSTQQGNVPHHGSRGAAHLAFSVGSDELDAWRDQLAREGVAIEAEVDWPQGGRSLYFRDPAGNSIELTTPSIWGLPER
jgi:catechol 2,3-dioxygenase-like lactoylglutathione lyase family enzyme